MKGYKVSSIIDYGREVDMQFTLDHAKAIQMHNDAIKKMIREKDCVTPEDFYEEIRIWKENEQENIFKEENNGRYEFLCTATPVIMYKDKKTNRQIADVLYMRNEWDICKHSIMLEEIEIVE